MSKEIPSGEDYLSNHHDLLVADNIAINPLGQLVAWTKANDLMVGMVIPIFKCDPGDPTWASATWFAAYQIIGVNPLVLEKVFKSRGAKNLHPAITLDSATLGGMGGVLEATRPQSPSGPLTCMGNFLPFSRLFLQVCHQRGRGEGYPSSQRLPAAAAAAPAAIRPKKS